MTFIIRIIVIVLGSLPLVYGIWLGKKHDWFRTIK